MKPLLAILLLSVPLAARPVSLVWDPALPSESGVSWRIWRGIDCIGTATTPKAVIDAATGDSITVSAINSAGESMQSAPVIVPRAPDMIQRSSDLETWIDVTPIPHADRQFIRIRISPP